MKNLTARWAYTDAFCGHAIKSCSEEELNDLKNNNVVIPANDWTYSRLVEVLWNTKHRTDLLVNEVFPTFLIVEEFTPDNITINGNEGYSILYDISEYKVYFLFNSKQEAIKYKLEND